MGQGYFAPPPPPVQSGFSLYTLVNLASKFQGLFLSPTSSTRYFSKRTRTVVFFGSLPLGAGWCRHACPTRKGGGEIRLPPPALPRPTQLPTHSLPVACSKSASFLRIIYCMSISNNLYRNFEDFLYVSTNPSKKVVPSGMYVLESTTDSTIYFCPSR